MSRRRRPPTLLEAAQEDVDQQWGRAQDELLPWDTKLAHKAKRWTKVIAAVAGLIAAGGAAVGTITGTAAKLWRVINRGALPPPDPPEHNPGVASTTVDRVPEPPKR